MAISDAGVGVGNRAGTNRAAAETKTQAERRCGFVATGGDFVAPRRVHGMLAASRSRGAGMVARRSHAAGMVRRPNPPVLRRSARIAGWIAFVAFELLVAALTGIVASIRCCGSAAAAGPQSPGEWAAFGVFAATMLLLGAAVGVGLALAVEGSMRLAGRLFRRREVDR